jgi:hypothetical protein
VTTCNRCGGVLPATATICHHCGTPVMNAVPGISAGGSLGARQRAQEKWGTSLLPNSGPLAGFPPPPPAGSMNPNLPGGPAGAGPSAPPNWRAPSLIDPAQLPDWLNPGTSGPVPPRLGDGGRGAPPGPANNAPRNMRPGLGASPSAGSAMPPASPRPPAPPRQQMPGTSPFYSGGRRATDDLFASSSLIDQNQLPDWLAPRSPRQQPPAAPPAGSSAAPEPSSPPPAPRRAPDRPQDPARDAHLPDWLRAMDPGAPPDLSGLNSGAVRSGGRPPASSNRLPAPEKRGPAGSGTSGADPFSISRFDAVLPPLEGFPPNAGPASAPGRAPAGNPDPFASRAPFSQAPFGQPPANQAPASQAPFGQASLGPSPVSQSPFSQPSRPGDSFPGANKGQGFSLPGAQQVSGAGTSGAWRPESRPASSFDPPAEGFSAGSLLDKTALPEWLQGPEQSGSASSRPAGQYQSRTPSRPAEPNPLLTSRSFESTRADENTPRAAAPSASSAFSSAPSAAPSPFDGASLVDEGSLPDWLRSSRETEPLPLPFTVSDSVGTHRATSDYGQKKAAAPAEDAGAADDDAVPEWLQQVYSEAHVPPLYEDHPAARSGPQKLSGSDLLDERSVPTWIREAAQTSPLANISDILASTPPLTSPEGLARPGAQPPSLSSTSGSLAGPLSARSLVDEEHLPEWLRRLDGEGTAAPSKGASAASEAGAASAASASGTFSAAELVDTSVLPTWLKTQGPQAGPATPAALGSASGLFSAAELVDTHALPTWMKEQEAKASPEPQAGLGQSAPLGGAAGLFSAAELVDTQARPTWLQESAPPAGPAAGATSGSLSQSGPLGGTSGTLSAAELVDTSVLPTWLKAQESGAGVGLTPGASSISTETRLPSSKMAPMPVGFQQTGEFSAVELVDTKALPTWLKEAGAQAGSTTSKGDQTTPARDAEGKMSASELVDTSVLPVWLRGAEAASTSMPGATSGVWPAAGVSVSRGASGPATSDQTGGFSAASLVDPDALPEWLRPAQSGALTSGPLSGGKTSGADWGEKDPREQSGFSAGSLIDPNELPTWMQSQEGTQRPGAQSLEGDAEEDGPQARVPRRPRLSTEPDRAPSQAAASVFSSVLGPSAGEDQRNQSSLGMFSSSSPQPPTPDRSNPFGQLSAQAQAQQGREGSEPSGWNLPQASRSSGPPRFEGEQGRGFEQGGAGGDWPGSAGARGQPEESLERSRPGYRPLGPLSEAQRSRQTFQPDASEESGPLSRRQPGQAGRSMAEPGYGMAGGQGYESFGERGFGDYAAGPQGRGAPDNAAYQEYDGWEGGPGYDQDFVGDDEAGPPSGMFAKLKRMLGFGR